MKHWKIASIIAATAAMMSGASSASANTALCAVKEPVCAAPLVAGTILVGATGATPEKALLTTSLVNVECMSSVEGETVGEGTSAVELPAKITALNWSDCHFAGKPAQVCSVTSVNLPYPSYINRTGENAGTLVAKTGEKAGTKPGATVNCGASILNCEFVKENAALEAVGGVAVGGAEVAFMKANGISLIIGAGSKCPSKAEWTATYFLNSPSKVYISQ